MCFVIRLHVTFCFNVSCYYFSRLCCKLCVWCFKSCLLEFYQLALQAVTTSPIFSNHILIYRHTTWLAHTHTSDTTENTDNTDSHVYSLVWPKLRTVLLHGSIRLIEWMNLLYFFGTFHSKNAAQSTNSTTMFFTQSVWNTQMDQCLTLE